MQMTRLWVHILVVHSIGIYVYADTHTLGDPEKDDKSGLYILCKVLSKKFTVNAMEYIYEECKVHI